MNTIFTTRMAAAFTARQQAHAKDFQDKLQALYTRLPDFQTSPGASTLTERLTQLVADLEQIRATLPDPVSQGKVLASMHILRSVLEVL